MLIDETYFEGPLEIAQLGQKAVVDKLNVFINRWEPVILEAALGYDFYQAFLTGINVGSGDTTEQRWLDLLNGVAFAGLDTFKRKWVGFAGGQNTQTVIAAQRPDLTIYAGITPNFLAGGRSYINESLKTWNYELELFGAGTLEKDVDWVYRAGGGWDLTNTAYTLAYGERYILHFTGKKVQNIQSGGITTLSPLAGFIYYEFMCDLATQNTGIGIVKNKGENSEPGEYRFKLESAYNQACKDIQILWEFLQAKTQPDNNIYPEFSAQQVPGYGYFGYPNYRWINYNYLGELYSFRPLNTFGI